jgi:predicted AAA+ superfamily ATPase
MLLQSQISAVVEDQNKSFRNRNPGLQRSLLASLKPLKNFTLILTGIRRCGKSTLLLQLYKKHGEKAFFLNFEDPRLAGFETGDFERLSAEIKKRKTKLLFFDEIQMLDKWEFFIRQKLDEDYKIVVTGSNAALLSVELGTKLTGRHLAFELFPFSYSGFLRFKNLKNTEDSLQKYLWHGGFPEYLKTGNGLVLTQLLEDILARDIAVRYSIRDMKSLRQLAVYLISNIGKPVSANKLKDLFQIKAVSTILDYFSHLENAYIVQFVPRFSYSLKTQIRNPKKVYVIDMGLFSHNSIVFSNEKGRRLENTVYLHLRRKYPEIYYFQEQKECDFVAMEKGKPIELLQVCYELTPDNLERELQGLMEAMDFFNLKKGKIITFAQNELFKKNGQTIEVLSAKDYIS